MSRPRDTRLSARRVAVLRALQLGDMLCAVPALRALRAALPDAEIVLIGLPWARAFVTRFRRYLDDFLAFPGYPGLPEGTSDVAAFPRFLAEAQRRGFDLVVQMHGSGEITNPLAVLLGGRVTAGFYRPGAFRPDARWFLAYPDEEPEKRRLLALMAFLGVPPRGEYLEFPLDDDDRESARSAAGFDLAGRPYVCVHPGARAPERRWPAAAFARVADEIAADGVRVVLTGSGEEVALTQEVARCMRAPAIDVAGRTTLGGLAALVARARLVVCNDTGVSHVADALDVPSVVVYSASDPRRWAPLDRKRHRIVDVRPEAMNAAVEGRTSDDAEIASVVAEARNLLNGEGRYAA